MFLCYFQFNKGSKVENKVVKVVVFSVRWPYCLIWLLARNTAAKLGLWNNLTLWNLALMCTESKIIAGYEFKCSFQECCVSSGPTLPYLFECKFKLLWLMATRIIRLPVSFDVSPKLITASLRASTEESCCESDSLFKSYETEWRFHGKMKTTKNE